MTVAQDWPVRSPLTLGWGALVLLLAGFGGWAAFSPIAGAIVASGQVDVDHSRQIVQHPDGGRVEAVLVAEGDRVAAGQILLRLDGAQLRSDLTVNEAALAELLAQIGRLAAERDDREQISFAPDLTDLAASDPVVARLMQIQERLFEARAENFRAQAGQLARRRDQIGEQVRGLQAEITATALQRMYVGEQLTAQKALLAKGLTVNAHVAELDREAARLAGVLGGYQAARAEAESHAAETDLATLQLTATRREQALSELRDLSARQTELAERRRALREKIAALDLRAPVAGVVLGLVVTGAGAVLRPSDAALYIVPQDRPFVVEARVATTDIDELWQGQPATLRFTAFDSHSTPELSGRIASISADTFFDQGRGLAYYRARIEIPAAESAKLGAAALVPGMPAEVFFRTRDRTPLSYFLMPLESFFNRALRES